MVNRRTMDQIVKALGLINSFRIDGLHSEVNPTSGARLNLTGGLESLRLTAADGKDAGINIKSQGFGVSGLSLPTPEDPSISLDPYLADLQIDLEAALFERLVGFTNEPMMKDMVDVVNRVEVSDIQTQIRMSAKKVVHLDVDMKHIKLQQNAEELIRIQNLSLSLLDFDTKTPPKEALKTCTLVLRRLSVEIEQRFFERVLEAIKSKLPPQLEELHIELPGPKMIVGGKARVKLAVNFRVDLSFETHDDHFGINFDRFYIPSPGSPLKLPGFVRTALLALVRGTVEKKLKGVAEVSNDALVITPWSKVPVEKFIVNVEKFAVENGKIVLIFTEPSEIEVPDRADAHAIKAERGHRLGNPHQVLAPGPAL